MRHKQQFIREFSTAEGRWAGFGPYYAMFPTEFAYDVIRAYSREGGRILDPFCGRGTSALVAKVLGRSSISIDINPVAWLYTKVKTDPANDCRLLLKRLKQVAAAATRDDRVPENEFQQWAWCPNVLGFLRAARRDLDWKGSRIDQTLMGFILVHLHAKIGNGLSNQMRQSKSMAPAYAVRWWAQRNMRPPQLDPVEYLEGRMKWRYRYGVVAGPDAEVRLGDASLELNAARRKPVDLVVTSPPYWAVTNYEYDNWIRLWMLGGPPHPTWSTWHRHADKDRYVSMIQDIFRACARHLDAKSIVCVRTDSRPFTLEATAKSLLTAFPDKAVYVRQGRAARSQTALYGDKSLKPGETDLLMTPRYVPPLQGFRPLDKLGFHFGGEKVAYTARWATSPV